MEDIKCRMCGKSIQTVDSKMERLCSSNCKLAYLKWEEDMKKRDQNRR